MKQAQSIYLRGNNKVGVLLLHGFTGSPFIFSELAEVLHKEGYTISAPLIAGHGTDAQRLRETNWKDWYHSVENAYFILSHDVEKVFVIGASFGSCLGSVLASQHDCAGLVTIGYPRIIDKQVSIKIVAFLLKLLGVKYFKKKIKLEDNNLLPTEPGSYPVIPIQSLSEFFELTGPITDQTLTKVTVPCLIIQSQNDGIVDPKSGLFVFENISSTDKELVWISEPHHKLHTGNDKYIIYSRLKEFMVRWM